MSRPVRLVRSLRFSEAATNGRTRASYRICPEFPGRPPAPPSRQATGELGLGGDRRRVAGELGLEGGYQHMAVGELGWEKQRGAAGELWPEGTTIEQRGSRVERSRS